MLDPAFACSLGQAARRGLLLGLAALTPPAIHAGAQSLPTNRHSFPALPNVVVILADDLGWGDPGVYHRDYTGQAPVIPTPHLDALAQRGMRFTDAHAPAALCAPTRYSMLTGNYPFRGRVRWGTWNYNDRSQILDGQRTAADVLRNAGYATAFIGKLHLGGDFYDFEGNRVPEGRQPDYTRIDFSRKADHFANDHGFDYSYAAHDGIQKFPYAYFENDRYDPIDSDDDYTMVMLEKGRKGQGEISFTGCGDPDWDGALAGQVFAGKAVDFIEEHHRQNVEHGRSTPFFLYYATPTPHWPHTPPAEFAPGVPVAGVTGLGPKADMIYELDLQIGAIVTTLERLGLLDDTLILVTSDNGGSASRGAEKAAGHRSCGPFRGVKGTIYEGGHRVPLIAAWGDGTPNGSRIAPGTVCDQLVSTSDWVATIYELTGTAMPTDQAMDSVSLLPMLLGRSPLDQSVRQHLILQAKPAKKPDDPPSFAVREGTHVLLLDGSGQPAEFYDLAEDPQQTRDLIGDPTLQQHIAAMAEYYQTYGLPGAPRTTEPYTPPSRLETKLRK